MATQITLAIPATPATHQDVADATNRASLEFQAYVGTVTTPISQAVDRLHAGLQTVDGTKQRIGTNVDTMAASVSALTGAVQALTVNSATPPADTIGASGRITQLELQQSSASNVIAALTTQVSGLSAALEEVRKRGNITFTDQRK